MICAEYKLSDVKMFGIAGSAKDDQPSGPLGKAQDAAALALGDYDTIISALKDSRLDAIIYQPILQWHKFVDEKAKFKASVTYAINVGLSDAKVRRMLAFIRDHCGTDPVIQGQLLQMHVDGQSPQRFLSVALVTFAAATRSHLDRCIALIRHGLSRIASATENPIHRQEFSKHSHSLERNVERLVMVNESFTSVYQPNTVNAIRAQQNRFQRVIDSDPTTESPGAKASVDAMLLQAWKTGRLLHPKSSRSRIPSFYPQGRMSPRATRAHEPREVTQTIPMTTISPTCPAHPDQSIESCPRECTWHMEGANESPARTSEAFESLQLESLISSLTRALSKSIRYLAAIKICHQLILLGFLTIAGSLGVGVWRSVSLDDLSGGFSLAQYILGVGIFVVGGIIALHAKRCTCWQSA